jgi:hypothetical protein
MKTVMHAAFTEAVINWDIAMLQLKMPTNWIVLT